MKKLTILVDMDDVLENLVECWVNELNRRYCTTVSQEDIVSWHIGDFFPRLSKAQLFEPLNDPDFWKTLTPMPNAPDILQQIIEDGHTVRIVTASHYDTVAPKICCLLSLYPYLKWEDVIIASDKSLIQGDVMIDDGVHNLEKTSCYKILFDRPHNRGYFAEVNGMVRVHTWQDIYRKIAKLAGGAE